MNATLAPTRRTHRVCSANQLTPGERLIVNVEGRSIGLFNVKGQYYAVHNRCPHVGGALCAGPLTGTTLPTTQRGDYVYAHEGHILRCAWHGWEFQVETGQCLSDKKYRAKTFPVTVEDGEVVVHF